MLGSRLQQEMCPVQKSAYESAIELDPQSAPTKFLYAGFLMRYMNDSEAAEVQLKKAMELDPDAYQIQIELARAYLYLGRHDETLEVIRALRERHDLQVFHLKKIYDLHLQHYYRRAENQFVKRDNVDTLQNLEKLRETFESLPPAHRGRRDASDGEEGF